MYAANDFNRSNQWDTVFRRTKVVEGKAGALAHIKQKAQGRPE